MAPGLLGGRKLCISENEQRIHLTPSDLPTEGGYAHPMKEDVKRKILFPPLAGDVNGGLHPAVRSY
jgi:hypothetical protein